jgi:hypothetical protein
LVAVVGMMQRVRGGDRERGDILDPSMDLLSAEYWGPK